MYEVCRHIKTNGIPCGSPALKGGQFCFYHGKAHLIGAEPHPRFGPLRLPLPEDPAAVQLSVALISDAVINNRMDLKKANCLFIGLQIAARFIDRSAHFDPKEIALSAELSPQGDDLAVREFECDDEEDCDDCPYADDCDRCAQPDDEDEDEENEDEDEDGEDEDEDSEDDQDGEDEDEDGEDDQDEESEPVESPSEPPRKDPVPVPDGLEALRRSVAEILDQKRAAG